MSAAAPFAPLRDSHAAGHRTVSAGIKLWKRLQSPFALVVEGFIVGCVLFLTLQPLESEPAPVPTGGGSMLSSLRV